MINLLKQNDEQNASKKTMVKFGYIKYMLNFAAEMGIGRKS